MVVQFGVKSKKDDKMKVSVITILDNTNYGTYLQALATGMAIQSCGHDVEIVHYTRWCQTQKGRSRTILKERGLLRWINRCVLKSSKKTFELRDKDYEFLKTYLSVTGEYIGFEMLKANPPKADIYLTGSDQVWNSVYNRGIDRSFYLDYAPIGKRRVAYAASIGMKAFPDEEKNETIALLRKYNAITVRESSAIKLLAELGVDSKMVLDPTLLLDKTQWKDVAKCYPFEAKEPYLLTYSVEYGKENKYIKHYAQKIAKKNRLRIYHVTYSEKARGDYYDKVFTLATPDQFLNLMLHASYIVVSSFHGTAFSVNFNKPFITVSPKRFNSRVMSLLELTGLESRLVFDDSADVETLGDIDYTLVNEKMQRERESSMRILSEMLSGK